MGAGSTLAIIIIIVIVIFVLPIVPVTKSNSSVLGVANVTYKADVSISFAVMNCGVVLNPTTTTAVLGYQVGESIAPTGFYCNISPSSS